jgi:hypothetical protein
MPAETGTEGRKLTGADEGADVEQSEKLARFETQASLRKAIHRRQEWLGFLRFIAWLSLSVMVLAELWITLWGPGLSGDNQLRLVIDLVLMMVCIFLFGALVRAIPIRWHCPNPRCDKTLCSTTPWKCGDCGSENRKTSFLDKCAKGYCRAQPRAYACEYCGTLTHFTKDVDDRNAATPLWKPEEATPRIESEEETKARRARQLEEYEYQKKELEYLIAIDRLKLQLTPKEVSEDRDARIAVAMKEMTSIVDDCTTIADSFAVEEKFQRKIDSMGFDDVTGARFRDLVSRKFELFRLQRGEEIPLVRGNEKRPSR